MTGSASIGERMAEKATATLSFSSEKKKKEFSAGPSHALHLTSPVALGPFAAEGRWPPMSPVAGGKHQNALSMCS